MDETWLYHCDPETMHSGSPRPRPKKFRVHTSPGKVLASIFWYLDCIILIDFLPKAQSISAEYYASLLVQLKDILKKNRRARKGHPGGLVLA
jgi:hypothetical protein